MRILLTTTPIPSHFFHLVPLAWALRIAGHDVLVGVQTGFADRVTEAGLPAAELPPQVSVSDMFGHDRQGVPVPWSDDVDGAARRAGHGFGRLAAHALDAVLELTAAWRPDLVISEPSEHAGRLAAAHHRIPWVEYEWGPVVHPAFTAAAHGELGPERARLGLAGIPRPDVVLDIWPRSLRDPGTANGARPMRFVPYNGSGAAPPWLLDGAAARRICVTLGSSGAAASDQEFLADVLDGVACLDVEVVVATNDAVGPLPSGMRRTGWLPLQLLLPTCDAVVHHGGIGTVLTSLCHGLPQLVLPGSAHDTDHAERLAASGAAHWLDPYDLTSAQVRECVEALLRDPAYRRAARSLGEEIAAQPDPAELVGALEQLVRR